MKDTAGYELDWAEKILLPHFPQQPSGIFFKKPRKVEIFGFQNKATGEQLNYTLDESETIGKDPNVTLSLAFDGIKRFNKGEKYLKLTCDNAPGQNKNNTTIRFLFYLTICGYYENIELSTMIAGHTKARVDSNFGMAKNLYWKSTVYSKKQFDEIVEKSSPAGLNKVQCYEDGKGFQYYNIKETLEKYFDVLTKIGKYHHFLVESSNPGVVKVKEFADSPWIEIDLLKTNGREREEIIEEIRNLSFPILKPKPLSWKRLMDFREICSLIPKEHWDDFFPELKHKSYTKPKYLSAQECLDISRKFQLLNSEVEEKIKTNNGFVAFVDLGVIGCSFSFAKVI